jgi:adenylyltransferase/sulfurtransferase
MNYQFMPEIPLEISGADVKRLRDEGGDVVLLDCREPEEHTIAAIAGARLMPMSTITERLGELTGQKDARLVVFCHLGGRSLRVATWLRQQGFAGAQSMAGGIDQWAVEIEPGMPRY